VIILDTHVWVNWLLLGESSLTPAIISAMANERDVAVSAISCRLHAGVV
jgi:PIN domain nuclease of toxin-antitoxin system